MDSTQIELLQASFRAVEPNADTLADLFYSRLFALNPPMREMFTHNAVQQKRKLLDMLAVVVEGVDQMDVLLPSVRELGRRHASYGVVAAHYAPVESALLWALEVTLADEFTAPVRNAWTQMYALLAREMQRGLLLAAEGETPGRSRAGDGGGAVGQG